MVTSWPEAEPKSAEYAYVDPNNSHYNIARLGKNISSASDLHQLDVSVQATSTILWKCFRSSIG